MYSKLRRKMILTAAAGSVSLLAASSRATQIMYEPFDYTTATGLGGATNNAYPPVGYTNPYNTQTWYARQTASAYTASKDVQVATGSLGYGGLAPSLGNSVAYGSTNTAVTGTNYAANIQLPNPITLSGAITSVYYSFMLTVNGRVGTRSPIIGLTKDDSAAASSGTTMTNSQSSGTAPSPASVWIRPAVGVGGAWQLGVSKISSDAHGNGAGLQTWQSTAPTSNQAGASSIPGTPGTYFVVAKYTFNDHVIASGQTDTVSMWVNPASYTLGDNINEAPAWTSSLYSTLDGMGTTSPASNADAAVIKGLVLFGHRQNTTDSADVKVDEIRVGTTWADVTPTGLVWDGSADAAPNPEDTGGSWETTNNWYSSSINANSSWVTGGNATFGTGSGSGSVAVSLANDETVGKITFTSTSPNYTLSGSGITLNGAGGAGLVANQSATINSAITVTADQSWYTASGATLATGNVSGAGAITKIGTGTVTANYVRAGGLTATAGTFKMNANGGNSGVSTVNTVAATGGKIDLNNNDLIVRTTGIGVWNGSNYDGVTGLIKSGRNGGAWDGNGLVTSQSNAISPNKLTSLAVASASNALGIGALATAVWEGQTVTGSDTLVKYTYTGDANLDGKINADDYFQLDSHYNKTADSDKSYFNGDFNYDGAINGDDYFLIDTNFAGQGAALAPPAGVSAVPEPASVVSLTLGGAMLLARSRRRRN